MAKKKDPWAAGSIDDTLKRRTVQYESLMNIVHSMDGEVQAKIARLLPKIGDTNLPDYEVLNRRSKRYDKALAEKVIAEIEAHYDVNNELSPFAKALDGAKLDDTSRELVKKIYHGHKDALVQAVGSSKYGQRMRTIQNRNREQVENSILEASSAGYNMQVHGDGMVGYLKKKHGLDMAQIDEEQLKRQAPQAIGAHLQGQLNADLLYDLAPRYKKKKAA